ncbi:MAG: DUF2817 domain-containing protein, partial [Gammaproteobacteria bacterium]|nr:DUF2817 domain-containing protein [Gammaproteobacteria bacterium]
MQQERQQEPENPNVLRFTRKGKVRRPKTHRKRIKSRIPELLELEDLVYRYQDFVSVNPELEVRMNSLSLPLYSITVGQQQRRVPTLLVLAGVHGIERIGSQVNLALLHNLLVRLAWDENLQGLMEKIQVVFLPILNPGGMYRNTRSNLNGVDLNRNSPIESEDRVGRLVGGQRFSKRFPWYRGSKGAMMEAENQVLERVIERQVANQPFAMALDIHSGFGFHDRIWFPYAYRREPMRDIDQYMALKLLWDRNYPHHEYIYEPQSMHYLTHGDLWDYFYKKLHHQPGVFMPLTLEMGSWTWIRKRPAQLFSYFGLF